MTGEKAISMVIGGAAEGYRRSYYRFFKGFWSTVSEEKFVEGPHIRVICDELQKIGEKVINRQPKDYDLIINVPPGSSKSTMATVLFPVWLWVNDPSLRTISGSFDGGLSMFHAQLSKDCIGSDLFQRLFPGVIEIRKDVDAKSFYMNTSGGFRKTTSTGANITGQHAHLIIVDDPLNPKAAKSEKILPSASEWIDKTLSTRKIDKANTPIILIMQRLHELDPAGNWIKKAEESGKRIRHICLPATSDYPVLPEELSKIYTDGFLDPVRLGPKVLSEAKTDLGSREYAGQYGQQPAALEGNIILREWLPVLPYHKAPAGARKALKEFVADTAYKEKTENDPSGILCYSEFKGYVFLWDYVEVRASFGKLINTMTAFIEEHGTRRFDAGPVTSPVYIEPKASGTSIFQYLRDYTALNVAEWKMPEGDKIARVNSISHILETKRVVLVEGPWNESFIDQCARFPDGAHDECVDTLVMATVNAKLRPRTTGYSYTK